MNAQEVLTYIETASDEELQWISNAVKSRKRPPRVMLSSLIGEDAARLAEVLPRTNTEYNGYRYAKTCSYYISILHSLTNLVLHNFKIIPTTRGIKMWDDHDSIIENKTENYRHVFHALSDTLLTLMEAYNTRY